MILPSHLTWILNHRVTYPNRRASVVFVLDFCLSQRCPVENAPVHWLQPAIHVPFFEKGEECAGNASLVRRVHGEVRFFPLPQDAQSLELTPVNFDITRSEFSTPPAKLRRRHLSLSTKLLLHFRLDGQAVAIPARNVRCTE